MEEAVKLALEELEEEQRNNPENFESEGGVIFSLDLDIQEEPFETTTLTNNSDPEIANS